jgi:3-hydroxybutyryl-CoA dehydrogenase
LTALPSTPPEARGQAERFFRALGLHTEWVADAPGMVLGRMVCQLVNEALFAVGEGVGSAPDIDSGLELGLNHPRGPIAWGDLIGYDHVLATVDALWDHFHDPRYRAAPELRRRASQQPT